MPSGHTQVVVFVTTYLYLKYKRINNIVKICIILSLLVMYTRIYLKKHTLIQVIVGAIFGILCGCMIPSNFFINH